MIRCILYFYKRNGSENIESNKKSQRQFILKGLTK